ncbi:MAG TPA: hypothetical protein VK153_02310 [Candidatus Paceibacterota bacterium]|nr:hypothetical protein [Candidatus Paceibacterota bacterium]
MKRIMNFLVNTKKGESVRFTSFFVIIVSFVIGLILSVPVFWMNGEYNNSWMNTVALYFFSPFIGYFAFFLFLFAPYMWYIGTSEKYKGNAKWILKSMAIFLSIAPGAIIYNSLIFKALLIPSGIHNLPGMLVCGVLYLLIVRMILGKPFSIIQEFVPLC